MRRAFLFAVLIAFAQRLSADCIDHGCAKIVSASSGGAAAVL